MNRATEKIAYLEGLIKGLDIKDEKTNLILDSVVNVLHSISLELDDQNTAIDDLYDCVDDLQDCTDEICEDLYGEEDTDYEDEDDGFFEVVCPSCGEVIYFDEEMLDSEDGIICPACNEQVDITMALENK